MTGAPATPARLAVLASGGGTNLQAVIDACRSGALAARIELVVSDVAGSGALARAARTGIPSTHAAPGAHADRRAYDRALADLVAGVCPDLVVLAGWMRLLSMEFLARFPMRVVNLHPALPGDLAGTRAIERAHAQAVAGRRTHTGVMVHFVPDEGVDDGPVIATTTVAVGADEPFDAFAQRMHAAEHALLVEAIRSVLADRRSDPRSADPAFADLIQPTRSKEVPSARRS